MTTNSIYKKIGMACHALLLLGASSYLCLSCEGALWGCPPGGQNIVIYSALFFTAEVCGMLGFGMACVMGFIIFANQDD